MENTNFKGCVSCTQFCYNVNLCYLDVLLKWIIDRYCIESVPQPAELIFSIHFHCTVILLNSTNMQFRPSCRCSAGCDRGIWRHSNQIEYMPEDFQDACTTADSTRQDHDVLRSYIHGLNYLSHTIPSWYIQISGIIGLTGRSNLPPEQGTFSTQHQMRFHPCEPLGSLTVEPLA